MKVEKLLTSKQKERYMLVDSNGEIVEPILRFLKYKDNVGAARNTLLASGIYFSKCILFNISFIKNMYKYQIVGQATTIK